MARLGDIFLLQMGKTPSRANKRYWDNGKYSWVSITDLSSYEKYVGETKEKISDLALKECGIKLVPENTVIMSFKLSLGKTAITEKPIYTNEAIMAFIPTGNYDVFPDYFYYLFLAKDWSDGTNRAVMGATLNKATLSKLQICVPSLDRQKEIANVLDKIYTFISLRKQQLSKLDELVKSRFIEMFGDPMVNPMGWRQTTVGESCYSVKDGPHVSPPYVEDGTGVPFISTRNLVNSSGIDWNTAKYISEADYDICAKKCKPEKGDILFTKGGTTGIARFVDTDRRFANWVHVAVLKFGEDLNGIFFEHMLNSDYCYKQSQLLTKGIANRDLVLGSMKQIRFFIPPLPLQNQFAEFVLQVGKSKLEIKLGLEKLELLKNALMQKYFG